jgi:hypothetical protein
MVGTVLYDEPGLLVVQLEQVQVVEPSLELLVVELVVVQVVHRRVLLLMFQRTVHHPRYNSHPHMMEDRFVYRVGGRRNPVDLVVLVQVSLLHLHPPGCNNPANILEYIVVHI